MPQELKKNSAYSFDDVLLVPLKSDIESREEVSISSNLSGAEFSLPIMSSPMDTVTGANMTATLSEMGGLPVVHRYCSSEEQVRISGGPVFKCAAAIGVTGDFLTRASLLYESGVKTLCLDVAHGHHVLVERAIKSIRDKYADSVCIIAGNVATAAAYEDLSSWGADAVRVGIGGGSICSTRIQTGHGVPTFQSVYDCARSTTSSAAIVADGGIRTSGDIVKALAAGADFVMLGSMLAGTDESPGQVFKTNDNRKYKVYRGMASVEAQVDWRGEARSLEGISTTIPYKGSVVQILKELEQNIKSGLSYSGARSISELQAKCKFIVQSSAGQAESSTHILGRSVK